MVILSEGASQTQLMSSHPDTTTYNSNNPTYAPNKKIPTAIQTLAPAPIPETASSSNPPSTKASYYASASDSTSDVMPFHHPTGMPTDRTTPAYPPDGVMTDNGHDMIAVAADESGYTPITEESVGPQIDPTSSPSGPSSTSPTPRHHWDNETVPWYRTYLESGSTGRFVSNRGMIIVAVAAYFVIL